MTIKSKLNEIKNIDKKFRSYFINKATLKYPETIYFCIHKNIMYYFYFYGQN